MEDMSELYQEIREFTSRVLKGECAPQETAILPAILKMLLESSSLRL